MTTLLQYVIIAPLPSKLDPKAFIKSDWGYRWHITINLGMDTRAILTTLKYLEIAM